MNFNKSNIYINLLNLTRNKNIYEAFTSKDTFNDRLIVFLIHLAFFFDKFNNTEDKKFLQSFFDYCFKQLETSIREIGHGDVTVNKKMKEYLNFFYFIVDKTKNWKNEDIYNKRKIVNLLLDIDDKDHKIVNYIDKYLIFLSNKSLNSFSKSVEDDQI